MAFIPSEIPEKESNPHLESLLVTHPLCQRALVSGLVTLYGDVEYTGCGFRFRCLFAFHPFFLFFFLNFSLR